MDDHNLATLNDHSIAPPTLPDVAGPSDAQAHYRIAGIQLYPPKGTRELDFIHEPPHCEFYHSSVYTPNSHNMANHNYQSTKDFTSQLPSADSCKDEGYRGVLDLEPEPETIIKHNMILRLFDDFQRAHSLTRSEGTAVFPELKNMPKDGNATPQDLDLLVFVAIILSVSQIVWQRQTTPPPWSGHSSEPLDEIIRNLYSKRKDLDLDTDASTDSWY